MSKTGKDRVGTDGFVRSAERSEAGGHHELAGIASLQGSSLLLK
jgi:hypothetical protein